MNGPLRLTTVPIRLKTSRCEGRNGAWLTHLACLAAGERQETEALRQQL